MTFREAFEHSRYAKHEKIPRKVFRLNEQGDLVDVQNDIIIPTPMDDAPGWVPCTIGGEPT